MRTPVPRTVADLPWTPHQRAVLFGGNGLALVLILGAWWGSAGTDALGDQIGWLDIAVLGLTAAGATNGAWLLSGRRTIGRRRRRIAPDPEPTRVGSHVGHGDGGAWLWLPGTRRAHLAGCQLLAGKPATAVDAATIRAERLVRCEVCG